MNALPRPNLDTLASDLHAARRSLDRIEAVAEHIDRTLSDHEERLRRLEQRTVTKAAIAGLVASLAAFAAIVTWFDQLLH